MWPLGRGILGTAETGWWQPSNSHMEMQAVSSAADDIPEDISHQQRDYVLWQQQKLARAGWAPAFPRQDIRRSDRGEHPAYPQLPNLWYLREKKIPKYVEFMKNNYPPDFIYEDFGPLFTAKFFDANQWADILQASGAKYVVLTSKHHEGFTLWGSEYAWNWNAVDEGPKRDIVKELEVAVRNRTGLRFGLYYSLFEWFHPLFLEDEVSSFQKRLFPVSKMLPELYKLVNKYQPEVLWSDGDGGAPDTYWNSTGFLAWLYNESPVRDTVVTNDRWGAGSICKHGGYYTCSDRYNPGHLLPHKWENCMTIDKFSWGYRRDAGISDYLTIEDLVKLYENSLMKKSSTRKIYVPKTSF
ncbi:fucosidase, alpha-L- 2, plasma [Camelus ferus]|nr:fucosidase, alpha-L- 2, plasma [Camelus ferus]